VTTALTEPSGVYDPAGIEAKATAQGDKYIIDGTKLFVTDAHVANYMIVAARTTPGKTAKGISLFIVDAKSPGIKVTQLKTIASDKQCEVVFNKVAVPQKNLLGKLNQGWTIVERMLQLAAAGKCAEMVGGAQQVLEMTVEYAKQRIQFGKPIGSFQAVQHHCANMATDVEGSRFITYEAAWMLSENMPCTKEVAMAKAWVSDAYRRVVSLGHQVHGGIGFTKDHDMQLYFRRAKAGEVLFGDGDYHREKVAQALEL
jgi:3-oxocholest-4-en-26-oyl-CoA dehydrogenase beta subunit